MAPLSGRTHAAPAPRTGGVGAVLVWIFFYALAMYFAWSALVWVPGGGR